MILARIQFENFKALRSTSLGLEPFTLIVGPNGSGKTSVMQALKLLKDPEALPPRFFVSQAADDGMTRLWFEFVDEKRQGILLSRSWKAGPGASGVVAEESNGAQGDMAEALRRWIGGMRFFSFRAGLLHSTFHSAEQSRLNDDGSNLAAFLYWMQETRHAAFKWVEELFCQWIPEYDAIVFTENGRGDKAMQLRLAANGVTIPLEALSDGTLFCLCLLAMAYQPEPPSLLCLEEPEAGLHPRLYREVQEALFRLAYPQKFGEKQVPIQVMASTHSPYFLDLFKDYPECVVIAEKSTDGAATFMNLKDDSTLREIIGEAPLGEVWYSGVLGGVPRI